MQPVVIYTDGGARGNPGPAGAGVVILVEGKKIELKKFLGERQTNNWAEYEAVALALQEAKKHKLDGHALKFHLDSQLVVEQLSGNWKIKEPTLKEQWTKVHALMKHFSRVTFTHIPRAKNKEADRLVNEAVDEAGF